MDQLKTGIPLLESLNTGRPSMGGTIVDNPEHSARLGIRRLAHYPVNLLGIRRLAHYPVNQAVKSNNAALRLAVAEKLGLMDIQGRQIGQRIAPLVLMFHLHRLARLGSLGGVEARAGLNAGLLIGGNHELVLLQGLALPDSLVEIK